MRYSEISRKTLETDIYVSVNLDGQGVAKLDFEPIFMKHMVTAMTVHSSFDVKVVAKGDLNHHIIEDIALCLGQAIREAIGDTGKIARYGQAIIPMDCSLALAAVDICNRSYSVVDLCSQVSFVEDTQCEDVEHFLRSFSTNLGSTIHLKVFYGMNEHHKIEATFKALGKALKQAVVIREEKSPQTSSKGIL
ncbi:MAG: imidazoleglycerol-phosphate dehydratase [Candidatus Thorarchaeota archaeon]|nr:imidazoleglycerol-phosphate dehydratase [Candidatus Thorarchaeota archaeon]